MFNVEVHCLLDEAVELHFEELIEVLLHVLAVKSEPFFGGRVRVPIDLSLGRTHDRDNIAIFASVGNKGVSMTIVSLSKCLAAHDDLIIPLSLLGQHEPLNDSRLDTFNTLCKIFRIIMVDFLKEFKPVIDSIPVRLIASEPFSEAFGFAASFNLHILRFLDSDSKLMGHEPDDLLSVGEEFGPAGEVDAVDQTIVVIASFKVLIEDALLFL